MLASGVLSTSTSYWDHLISSARTAWKCSQTFGAFSSTRPLVPLNLRTPRFFSLWKPWKTMACGLGIVMLSSCLGRVTLVLALWMSATLWVGAPCASSSKLQVLIIFLGILRGATTDLSFGSKVEAPEIVAKLQEFQKSRWTRARPDGTGICSSVARRWLTVPEGRLFWSWQLCQVVPVNGEASNLWWAFFSEASRHK